MTLLTNNHLPTSIERSIFPERVHITTISSHKYFLLIGDEKKYITYKLFLCSPGFNVQDLKSPRASVLYNPLPIVIHLVDVITRLQF